MALFAFFVCSQSQIKGTFAVMSCFGFCFTQPRSVIVMLCVGSSHCWRYWLSHRLEFFLSLSFIVIQFFRQINVRVGLVPLFPVSWPHPVKLHLFALYATKCMTSPFSALWCLLLIWCWGSRNYACTGFIFRTSERKNWMERSIEDASQGATEFMVLLLRDL